MKAKIALISESDSKTGREPYQSEIRQPRPLILASVVECDDGSWSLFPHRWADITKPFNPTKRTTTWYCCLNGEPHGLVKESDLT